MDRTCLSWGVRGNLGTETPVFGKPLRLWGLPKRQRELVGDWETNKRTVERMGFHEERWKGGSLLIEPERNGNISLPHSAGQRKSPVAGEVHC